MYRIPPLLEWASFAQTLHHRIGDFLRISGVLGALFITRFDTYCTVDPPSVHS